MTNMERRQLHAVIGFLKGQYGVAKEQEAESYREANHDYYLGLRLGYENALRMLNMVGLMDDEHVFDAPKQQQEG
jgi:hypothetical protein